jgi:hypothetical protein
MSAAEVIEQIKALPPAEDQEVEAFVTQRTATGSQQEVRYASEEAVLQATKKIGTRYAGFFKNLAE